MSKNKFEVTGLQKAELYFGSKKKLSLAIGKNGLYIKSVVDGRIKLPIDVAMDIERATNGAVGREELRPDIFEGFVRVENEQ